MQTLETERLVLRAWQFSDVGDLYEYACDPFVGPDAGWKPHESVADSLRILQSFIDKDEVWALELKENGKVIGSLGLHPDGRRSGVEARELGYVLSAEYWGRGLATEAAKRAVRYAFEVLKLDVLSVSHFPFNERSKRVIEKCGFTCEGTLRRFARRFDGLVLDYVFYSMLREEFERLYAQ